MTNKITIALDCMGGDNAPDIVLKGANIVTKKNSEIDFLLFGDSAKINPILKRLPSLKTRSQIIHTEEFITADEKPSNALRRGQKSSMRLAIDAVKDGRAHSVVSAGNTGALMAIAKVILRPLPSIDRPAIVTSLPNQKKKATVFLDMGANVECDSEVLYQFAVMGHAFAKTVLNIENPTIGLLNVGSEDLKGSDAVRNAAVLLRESELANCFVGYVEGDDIVKGTVDVVVTDGFCGNAVLKAIEGTAKMISGFIRESFFSSIFSQVGYLLSATAMNRVKKTLDPRLHNGAMLIGLNGVVVKSHGSADDVSFANAIGVAISLVKNDVNAKIIEEIRVSKHSNEDLGGEI